MDDRGGTLAARSITKGFGAENVLDGVSLTIPARSRIGVVGPNGVGKSTLLRILAGLEQPDAGVVERRPPTLTVGYGAQEADAAAGETVLAYLARRTGVAAAEKELEDLAARLEHEPELAQDYVDALERFLALAGDDLQARARAVCRDVGLPTEALERPIAAMSGGEASRAGLAAILLARFDVFLLDEPTNNLDFAGLKLLESFVDSTPASVVVVSHDRAFLERAVDRVLVFEAETRRVAEFGGGWAAFERDRVAVRERHERAWAAQVGEHKRFTSLLAERRTQARGAGGMADRRGTHALSSKVRSAERRLDGLETVEKPWEPWRLHFSLDAAGRNSEVVARLSGAMVERKGFTLGPLDVELRRRERLAVTGRNGSGKSTLIAALLGELPLSAGTRHVGPGVRFGELDQARGLFDVDEPLLEPFVARTAIASAPARTLLAKFGLGADALARPASSLSPGERTRATLALLSAGGVNCLVLDEPTNHLDLPAIEELEAALEGFDGTLVLVTHDRRFLERFRATRTLALEGGLVVSDALR